MSEARRDVSTSMLAAGLVVVVVSLVAILAPIWVLTRFPSLDGPEHVAASRAIAGYAEPADAVLRRYVETDLSPSRSPLGHVLLAALAFLSPSTTTKVLLSAYALSAIAAGVYACTSFRRTGITVAPLLVPVFFGLLFHLGFWDFMFAVVLFLVAVGYWARHSRHPSTRHVVTFGVLALLMAAFQPSPVLPLAGVAVVWSLAGAAANRAPGPRRWLRLSGAAATPLVAMAPAIVLLAVVGGQEEGFLPRPALGYAVRNLVALRHVRVLSGWPEALAAVVYGFVLIALISRLGRRRVRGAGWEAADVLFVAGVLAAAAAVLAPAGMAGAAFVNERAAVFAAICLVLWFAAQPLEAPELRVAMPVTAVAVLAILLVRLPVYARADAQLEEIARAGEAMSAGSTFVTLFPDPAIVAALSKDLRVPLIYHVGGWLAAERELVQLDNYEGNCDYFPFDYRPELDPYRHLSRSGGGCLDDAWEDGVDLLGYEHATGGTVDFVVTIGAPTGPLRDQLEAAYDNVFVSEPKGLARVWQRSERARGG